MMFIQQMVVNTLQVLPSKLSVNAHCGREHLLQRTKQSEGKNGQIPSYHMHDTTSKILGYMLELGRFTDSLLCISAIIRPLPGE